MKTIVYKDQELEQLRIQANNKGYSLSRKTEKLLPCICGHNRRTWIPIRPAYDRREFLKKVVCKNCGLYTAGFTKRECVNNWNKMIERYRELQAQKTDC